MMPARKPKLPNHRLRTARQQRGWSLKDIADQVGTDRFTVGRWERGVQGTSPHFRRELCKLFGMDAFALGLVEERMEKERAASEAPKPPIWHVPMLRNPYRTGLDQRVGELRERLVSEQGELSLLALSGLGGIGKTQLVLEYTYRYGGDYKAVLWVHADSPEKLSTDLELLASLLDVPEMRVKKRQPNPAYLVNEVKQWLREHDGWLLVLDNVEEQVPLDFLSSLGRGGHVLLTTRSQRVADRGQHLVVEKMPLEVGALLLLRILHRKPEPVRLETFPVSEREEALALAHLLGSLPLALEQAGAYMRETGRNPADYRRAYPRYRKIYLAWRITYERTYTDYSESVATTWLSLFQLVRRKSPSALALLHLCAFLQPDAIPRDILLKGTYDPASKLQPLTDEITFDTICGILINYALIRRSETNGMLSLHRLVQAVLKDRMSEQQQQLWAERTVHAVENAWSQAPESDAEQYLPHAYVCATLIKEREMTGEEAARLLERAANAAAARGWSTQALPLYQRAHEALAQILGEDDPHVIRLHLDVAHAFMEQWQYHIAIRFYQQAYQDCVRLLGLNHLMTIACLNDLALAQLKQGRIDPALKTVSQVIDRLDQAPDQHPAESAKAFQIVGEIEQLAGHDERAEEYYLMALDVRLRVFGHSHVEVARSLLLLSDLYAQHDPPPERLEQAERWLREALAIFQEILGEDHPETAYGMLHLGLLFSQRGKANQAVECCRQAAALFERKLGLAHYSTGQGMYFLAMALKEQKQYPEAERYFCKAKDVLMVAGGPESALYLHLLSEYAELLRAMGREDEASQYEDYVQSTQQSIAARGGPILSFSLPSLNEEGLPGSLWIVPRPDWDVPEEP
jgi:tetratricopeptide (TPR) repeat protein/transcriptional regulator with XRE-family HTH domain